MAAARNCRATVNVGLSLNFSVRPRSLGASPFLLKCTRSFNNTTPFVEADTLPPNPPVQTPQPRSSHDTHTSLNDLQYEPPHFGSTASELRQARQEYESNSRPSKSPYHSPRYDLNRAPTAPVNPPRAPLRLTPTIREYLPHLTSQPPFYITIHIHGKPYLVTEGDTIRLPFLMHGVMPGDVLRLDRASVLGSREWTLRAGSETSDAAPNATALGPQDAANYDAEMEEGGEPLIMADPIIGRTDGLPSGPDNMHLMDASTSQLRVQRPKRRNKPSYLDPRLYVCRATVLGTESEPMRIIEKTKARQRHVKHVKSRMRFTMLRISEIVVKHVEELESEAA